MVGELLYEWDPDYILPPTAMYLYAGIVTDTNRFLYNNTRASTLRIASKLIETNFDRQKINDAVYLRSLKEAEFDSYVISRFKYNKKYQFGYAVLGKKSFDKFDIELRMSMVHVFNNIRGLEV